MLSEFKKISEYPTLETPVTIRLGFYKKGALQYISHLDLQRTFQRILSRAELPLWYTQGFNPHPKLVFSLPLSLGAESVCEFLDIRVLPPVDYEKIKESLNKNLPDDIQIKRVYTPKTKLEDLCWSRYTFKLYFGGMSEEKANEIKEMLSSPMIITKRTKKTKSGLTDIDILPGIKSSTVTFNGEYIEIVADLESSVDNYINPDYIISALDKFKHIDFEQSGEYYTVMKEITFRKDCKKVFE